MFYMLSVKWVSAFSPPPYFSAQMMKKKKTPNISADH